MGFKRFGWQKEAENYFSSTPHPKGWFEFLGWLTALSTLNFLSEKTGSLYIKVLYFASYAVLYNHIQKFLYTTKFQRYIPLKISSVNKNRLAYFISAGLVVIVYLFTLKVVEDITKSL